MNAFTVFRKKRGLTQVEAAEALGCDKSTVAKWEAENTIPRRLLLKKVAALYGCRVSDLLDEVDEDDTARDTAKQ